LEVGGTAPLDCLAVSGDRVILEVQERGADQLGSRRVRRLRKEGLIPGVIYGKGEPTAIVVGERDLRSALTGDSGLHAIIDVVVAGKGAAHHAVVKQFQKHPIRGTITHVDFHEVRLDQPIQATVIVHLVGEAPGSKLGGVVQQSTRELRLEALPARIPEYVEVDLSGLGLGDVLRLESLPPIDDVTFLDDPHETVLVSCVSMRAADLEEEEGEGEAEAAEGDAGAADASAQAQAETESPSDG
jgi:large subunit ribosomal protein L25